MKDKFNGFNEIEAHKYAALVPMAMESEQIALNNDILKNGLNEPIMVWKGKIIDGRCRQKACIFANEKMRFTFIDDEVPDNQIKIMVKSLNTRRNLSNTQKIISACKTYIDPDNNGVLKQTQNEIAESWGISTVILKNGLYIHKTKPSFIEPLFNGLSVEIEDKHGSKLSSNKISTIYAYLKRQAENSIENTEHAWNPDSYINTVSGKEWYYEQLKSQRNVAVSTKMLIAELANFKFQATCSETGEVLNGKINDEEVH